MIEYFLVELLFTVLLNITLFFTEYEYAYEYIYIYIYICV